MSVPAIVSARTVPFAFGSQETSARPLPLVDSFAIRLRVCPPIEENEPPAKRLLPESARTFTTLSAFGAQVPSTAPAPAAATLPMKKGGGPRRLMKLPPAYTKLASEASASTDALALAAQVASGVPEFVVDSFTSRVCVAAFT